MRKDNSHRVINNKTLDTFLLFTAWPVVNLIFSITMYLFIPLFAKYWNINGRSKSVTIRKSEFTFYLLGFVFLLSTFAIPPEIETTISRRVLVLIQHIYWVFQAVFFIRIYPFLNQKRFSKYVFIGLLLLVITFFFQGFLPRTPIISFRISRNAFVFILLCLVPISTLYFVEKAGKRALPFYLIIITAIMFLTGGRAGSIIILIECILILSIFYNSLYRFSILFLFVALFLGILLGNPLNNQNLRNNASAVVENFSPRLAQFVAGKGDAGDLTHDRSWLTRTLMIKKGKEIISKYPVFGVGPLNFTKYIANLEIYSRDAEYARLAHRMRNNETSDLNSTSSHNSYVQIMSEYGIVGFTLIIVILLRPLLFFLSRYLSNKLDVNLLPFISLFSICIHFYTISSFVGTITWFIIGITYGSYSKVNVR